MAEYLIDILDQDLKGGVRGRHSIEFEDDTTALEAIDAIIQAFELPRRDSRGEERRYMLGFQGDVLDLGQVLAHSVPHGGTLMLSSDASVA